MHQHNILSLRGNRIQRMLNLLLPVLASSHDFDFLLPPASIFFGQKVTKSFHLIFPQRNPDFRDRIDCGERPQGVNQDRRARQIRELFRGMGLLGLRVQRAGHGRHARPQTRSGNYDDHLHGGL
jgi:hypothetical protein